MCISEQIDRQDSRNFANPPGRAKIDPGHGTVIKRLSSFISIGWTTGLYVTLAQLPLAGLCDARAETIDEAIAQALAHNPALQAADAQIGAADEVRNQAEGAYGPTLSLDVTHDYTSGDTIDGSYRVTRSGFGTTGALTLTQPLFTFGRLASGAGSAQAGQKIARANRESARQTLLLDVVTAYAQVRRDLELYQVAQQNRALLQSQHDMVQSRYDLRDATAPDVEQIAVRLAIASGRLADTHAQVEQSAARYRNLVGHYPRDLAPLPPTYALPAIEDLYSAAAEHSPDLAAAQLNELAARYQVAQARAATGPLLSGHVSAQREPLSAYENGPRYNAVVAGVTLSMPLYSGGQLSAAVHEAEARDRAAQHQVEQARRDVRENIAVSWGLTRAARERLPAYRQAVSNAERAVAGIRQQERAGIRTLREVLDATDDLLSARTLAAQAEADAVINLASALRAAGLLDEDLFQPRLPSQSAVGAGRPSPGLSSPDASLAPITRPRSGLPLRPAIAPVDGLFVSARTKPADVAHEADDTFDWPAVSADIPSPDGPLAPPMPIKR